jgi:hypothetical protein
VSQAEGTVERPGGALQQVLRNPLAKMFRKEVEIHLESRKINSFLFLADEN